MPQRRPIGSVAEFLAVAATIEVLKREELFAFDECSLTWDLKGRLDRVPPGLLRVVLHHNMHRESILTRSHE
jgi:hypothetical protein